MELDEDKKNLFDVSLSENIKISFEQSSYPYDNYTYQIRGALLRQIEEDILKIDQIKEEPGQSSEDVIEDYGTSLHCIGPKIEDIKEEPGQSSEDVIEDYGTSLQSIGPKIEDIEGASVLRSGSAEAEEDSKIVEEQTKEGVSETNTSTRINESELNKSEPDYKQNKHTKENYEYNVNEGSKRSNAANILDANEGSKRSNAANILDANDKIFCCDLCPFKSKWKWCVSIHNSRVHPVTKHFSCHLCSFECSAYRDIIAHRSVHRFSCHLCSSSYIVERYLTMHIMKHKGEMPFSCHLCSKKYVEKKFLTRHYVMKHKFEKSFSLDTCLLKFVDT